MWWPRRQAARALRGQLSALIDEGSEIEGKYTFSGEISTTDTLIVSGRAVVNATVRAGTVVVNGELVGNVEATERVELKGHARVFGDVKAPVVVVEEGVLFEGHCRMAKPGPPEIRRHASVVPFKLRS